MNRSWLGLLAFWCGVTCASEPVAEEPEWNWYRNDTQCGDTRITIRSYCAPLDEAERANMVVPANYACGEQELHIAQPGKRVVKLDLRKYEHDNEEFRVAKSVRCVAAGKQRYLLVGLDNGGNCDTCETSALLTLGGRWKSYGDKWMATPPAERKAIEAVQRSWWRLPEYHISNMQRADDE